ncbi:uncharacterized protein [Halyomorpha halys]|uniref:uncharacterized protein n=1 Tax=Halyomorpha halys TaxID=286706 RepID=UPI0006D51FEC|nr:uncharacterized protein LOC106691103 [Halyomorpha halys]
MGLAVTLFGIFLVHVLQGSLAEGQQTTNDDQGVIVSYGSYLKPKREQVRLALNDGDEIQGGFTPLPSLGPQEYGSPSFQAERPPLKKPHRLSKLRPKPLTPGGPYNQFGNARPNYYDSPNNPPPRPPRPSLFNRYY